VADYRGPEDMVHVLMGAGEVRGLGKSEGPLVQEASELDQGQGRGYNDLLQIEKEKRECGIHEVAGSVWSCDGSLYLDAHPSYAQS
jgi:hypothetical protein